MTLPRIQSLVLRRRVQALAIALLVPFLAVAPLHLLMPATAKAHGLVVPVQVGISFSPSRAAYLGLDYRSAFTRLEALHFRVIRLSAYWDQIDRDGYAQLDWLMSEARRSGQPIALTVGMISLFTLAVGAALGAFRTALEINPGLDDVDQAVKALEEMLGENAEGL